MRVPIQLYDKRGIPIQEGDMIKTFHFRGRGRFRNNYLYHKVTKRDGFWFGLHYPFDKPGSGYDLQSAATNGILPGEIVCEDHTSPYITENLHNIKFWKERPRIKIEKESDR